MRKITTKIFDKIQDLPENWNAVAAENHFLQTPYLKVLELSAPTNMKCFYIGIYELQFQFGISITHNGTKKKVQELEDRFRDLFLEYEYNEKEKISWFFETEEEEYYCGGHKTGSPVGTGFKAGFA